MKKRLLQILKEQEDEIYGKYKKILDSEIDSIKQWKTGEKIYYQGEEFTIIRESSKSNRISMKDIHDTCVKYGKEGNKINYVKGANIGGFIKVAEAMKAQGIV